MPYYPLLGGVGTISSGIGSRSSPGGIGSTNHKGIDIAAPLGTGVIAPVDLTIKSAGWSNSAGNMVQGIDQNGNVYKFMHLSDFDVNAGDVVQAGSLLGAVGSTGNSTGNHLHIGIFDSAGNLLKQATQEVVEFGKKVGNGVLKTTENKAKAAAGKAIEAIPVVGKPIAGVTNALGITGECNILCQIKNWLSTSEFFQRVAFVILGLILILMAFYLFGTGQVQKMVKEAAG